MFTVLNKIDLASADPERVKTEIEDVIGIDASDAIPCSAKTGSGIPDILEKIVRFVPAPKGDPNNPLQALIIDAWFDNYVGVVMLVRIVEGTLSTKDKITLMSSGRNYAADQIGIFTPKPLIQDKLVAGEVGFVIAGIKELATAKVGDTITGTQNPAKKPLPGFREIKPQVFAGLYPVESNQFEALRTCLLYTSPSPRDRTRSRMPSSA